MSRPPQPQERPIPGEAVERALESAELSVEGRILVSSNAALLVSFSVGTRRLQAIYKPIARERPLWDYPDGTLAGRERAAYLVSELGGWGVIPPTVMRGDGPMGSGSVQLWVDGDSSSVVDIIAPGRVPHGWCAVIEGSDQHGESVLLVHTTDPPTRRVAVLDLVLNTSDRKGSHLIRSASAAEHVWGVDHGVSLGVEPKVRTVLWGFMGQRLSEEDLGPVRRLRDALESPRSGELAEHLTAHELAALSERADALLERPVFPGPSRDWPAVPWPAL